MHFMLLCSFSIKETLFRKFLGSDTVAAFSVRKVGTIAIKQLNISCLLISHEG